MTKTRSSLCIVAVVAGVFGSIHGCANTSAGYGPPPEGVSESGAATSTSGGLTDCSCITETFNNPACFACNESVTADSTECQPQSQACASSPGCSSLYACVVKCATGSCIDACVSASDQASTAQLKQVFECACARCSATCTAPTKVECVLAESDAGADDESDAGDAGDVSDAGDAGD